MIQTKREEWEQACSDYPELSPFTLLKLSMVRYGAVLSPNALSRLQDCLLYTSPSPRDCS